MSSNSFRFTFVVLLLITTLMLGFFQFVWVGFGSPTSIVYQVVIQRARSERFEKDALILLYRPTPTERIAAISEMQNALPLFEQVENGLINGDKSLGLPKHPPTEIYLDMVAANGDYLTMDVAVTSILANLNKPINPAQVQILIDHEHKYALAMSVVTTLWQNQIDNSFYNLFWIEMSLDSVLIALIILASIFPRSSGKASSQ